jgi:hypothetical protein
MTTRLHLQPAAVVGATDPSRLNQPDCTPFRPRNRQVARKKGPGQTGAHPLSRPSHESMTRQQDPLTPAATQLSRSGRPSPAASLPPPQASTEPLRSPAVRFCLIDSWYSRPVRSVLHGFTTPSRGAIGANLDMLPRTRLTGTGLVLNHARDWSCEPRVLIRRAGLANVQEA